MHDMAALSAYWFALSKDSPGKTWWRCPANHPRVYAALGIDPADYGAIYAVAPLRYYGAENIILASYPTPRLLDEPEYEWLGIETVIAWNPADDTAVVMGDPAPQIVGNLSDATNVIFASPRAFFRHWARRRAQFLTERKAAVRDHWHKAPRERDETPGALMIGAPTEIRWRPSAMPADIQCVGVNPTIINKALLKAARVPRARGGAE